MSKEVNYYRETEKRVSNLEKILNQLTDDKMTEEETLAALLEISKGFIQNRKNEDMLFYSLVDPSDVPGDVRVDLAYEPTYLACGVMVYASLKYPGILADKTINHTLSYGLNACTGRAFKGHGYEGTEGFLKAMDIFARCRVSEFLDKYPEFNVMFTLLFDKAVEYLRDGICSGKVKDMWTNKDYIEQAEPIYRKIAEQSYKI
ncbi:MAG: hypothetical protein ACI4GV_08405 [Acutalibacteraceae bacterium]